MILFVHSSAQPDLEIRISVMGSNVCLGLLTVADSKRHGRKSAWLDPVLRSWGNSDEIVVESWAEFWSWDVEWKAGRGGHKIETATASLASLPNNASTQLQTFIVTPHDVRCLLARTYPIAKEVFPVWELCPLPMVRNH